ncbi:MAG: carboxylesterase family protein [Pseudomonadota bacterium]
MATPTDISRRSIMLAGAAAIGAGCTVENRQSSNTSAATDEPSADSGSPAVRTDVPVAETTYGPVQGYWRNGVYVWKGVPYGAATGPTARFAAPMAPEPWSEVRRALTYGPICPTGPLPVVDLSANEWPFMLTGGAWSSPSEDCLRLNIWSPSVKRKATPVMVWLHADGFGGGSSQKYLSADGENLARTQEVVVVSLNHRVGPLGFSNFSWTNDPRLQDSANVGMLDIVHALVWIRDNISSFGGDPDNVTVFGQSGGGFKISALMAMPSAQGLFHKAIIQSGARLAVHDPDTSARLGAAILQQLGIENNTTTAEQLAQVPVDDYIIAARQASGVIAQESIETGYWQGPAHWFEPTAGLPQMPSQPFSPDALRLHTNVPVICGTVRDEASPSVNAPDLEAMSREDAIERLRGRYGDQSEAAFNAAVAEFPDLSPVALLSVVSSFRFRAQALEACRRLSNRGTAPVYNYVFDWGTPLFEGRPRAFHTSDVAFAFANTDLLDAQTGGGNRPRQLSNLMSGMWAKFARSGRPTTQGGNVEGWAWPAYTENDPVSFIFNDQPSLKTGRDLGWVSVLQPTD